MMFNFWYRYHCHKQVKLSEVQDKTDAFKYYCNQDHDKVNAVQFYLGALIISSKEYSLFQVNVKTYI